MNDSSINSSLQRIELSGHIVLLPSDFQKLRTLPDDPSDSLAYGMQTDGTSCFLLMYPLQKTRAMPFGDTEVISEGIHRNLGDKQGLIEIASVEDSEGRQCVYTIVKSLKEPSGVQYNLTLQIQYPEHVLHFQGFFDEGKMTGTRDAMVLSLAMQQGILKPGSLEGWSKDPYDESFTNGIARNLSEDEAYDALFPDHPLSTLRRFVRTVLQLPAPEQNATSSESTTWQPVDYILSDGDKPVWGQ